MTVCRSILCLSMTNSLLLTPLTNSMLPLFYEWFNSPTAHGEFDAPEKMSLETLQQRFDQDHFKSLRVVLFDDEAIGWTDMNTFPEYPETAKITVQISKPEFRGRGLGRQIHELALADFLSANKAVRWVEAWTHIHNIPEQRILEKIGFKRDAHTRKFEINGNSAEFYSYELELRTY